jgi:hypothetical protein
VYIYIILKREPSTETELASPKQEPLDLISNFGSDISDLPSIEDIIRECRAEGATTQLLQDQAEPSPTTTAAK